MGRIRGMQKPLLVIFACMMPLIASAESLKWESWTDDLFVKAKKEQRFVILDLEAVWCHWCHVMDEKTYANEKVQKLLHDQYVTVRVDQDSRPDLSNRYEDYGWPATVIFAPDGSEIVRRRGYIPPEEMISLLEAIKADPSPGPSIPKVTKLIVNETGTLSEKQRADIEETLKDRYDEANGGWGIGQKFLDWENTEWSLRRALQGDQEAEKRARKTIVNERKLLDPIWGGMYQYSTDNDWDHPHFEKIMSVQAENLRIAALAFAQWHDEKDLHTSQEIVRYVRMFLTSPEGAFYTSQDADLVQGEHSGEYFALDDAGRRAKGLPRVDTHIYTRENAWMICGLTALYDATGDESYLTDAKRAAGWILQNRTRTGGGFAHGEEEGARFFGDQVYLLRAMLALHTSTADQVWLERAEHLAASIQPRFVSRKTPLAGFTTMNTNVTSTEHAVFQVDENVALCRAANHLFQLTGKVGYRQMAVRAMRYLAAAGVVESRYSMVGGFLLADDEMRHPPLHVTLLSRAGDAEATKLYQVALQHPSTYKRLDWFDPAGPKPANLDVDFPAVKKATAFVCGEGSCSAPVTEVADLQRLLMKSSGPK